jgi:hypothetical protein
MSDKVNLVRVFTASTGTSTMSLGSAFSQQFMTPAEAGAVNGRTYTYLVIEGNDWELGKGVYTSSGTTLSRVTVRASRIAGTLGTSKITLNGTAQVRFIESAFDMDGVRGTRSFTGTSDSIASTDLGYMVTYSNASAVAVSIAQAGTAGFDDAWATWVQNLGVGTLTITPATSTVNGSATLALATNMGAFIWSDGTNYYAYFVPVSKPLLAANNLVDIASASSARTNLGATTVGSAVFTATNAPAARTSLGSTTIGDGVFTATDDAAARTVLDAAPIEALSSNNIIINGGMEVSQANGTSSVVSGGLTYTVDQFLLGKSGTMVINGQQVTDAPAGFSNSLKVTVGTALASLGASDFCVIQTPVEGYRIQKLGLGTSSASPFTLGFWVKAHRTGGYSGSIQNSAQSRSWPFSFTINVSDTWEYKTISISPELTGTWLGQTNIGMRINWAIAASSSLVATANMWATTQIFGVTGTTNGVAATTDTFQLTGVSLLPRSVSVSAAHSAFLMRSYDVELQLSRRYYELVGMTALVIGNNLENTSWYRASKRVSPTLSVVSGTLNSGTVGVMALSPLEGFRQLTNSTGAADILIAADARL